MLHVTGCSIQTCPFLSSRWWICSSSCSCSVSGWWRTVWPNKASSSTMTIGWTGLSVGRFMSHTAPYLGIFPQILIVSGDWKWYYLVCSLVKWKMSNYFFVCISHELGNTFFALRRRCIWHRVLQHEWHRPPEAQVSCAEWKPNTSLPRVAHHHHALRLLALCQHTAAQPAHSHLQVSSPPHPRASIQSQWRELCLSLCSCAALRSRKFRITRTGYGSFKDMSWLRSTTAALPPLLLSSSSAIFTSSSGTWCCAGRPSYTQSSVSIELVKQTSWLYAV